MLHLSPLPCDTFLMPRRRSQIAACHPLAARYNPLPILYHVSEVECTLTGSCSLEGGYRGVQGGTGGTGGTLGCSHQGVQPRGVHAPAPKMEDGAQGGCSSPFLRRFIESGFIQFDIALSQFCKQTERRDAEHRHTSAMSDFLVRSRAPGAKHRGLRARVVPVSARSVLAAEIPSVPPSGLFSSGLRVQ